jgi:hypothetical protein
VRRVRTTLWPKDESTVEERQLKKKERMNGICTNKGAECSVQAATVMQQCVKWSGCGRVVGSRGERQIYARRKCYETFRLCSFGRARVRVCVRGGRLGSWMKCTKRQRCGAVRSVG